MIHKIIGLALFAVHIFIMLNMETLLPTLAATIKATDYTNVPRSGFGILCAVLIPVIASLLLILHRSQNIDARLSSATKKDIRLVGGYIGVLCSGAIYLMFG